MIKLIFIASFIILTSTAKAYTNFIGHSYTSCLNCHYNPFGGGPVNDYGRAVAATAISSGAFTPDSWDQEKVAYTSGFLFRKPKQDWLRTQINYRGFQLVRNPGSAESEHKEWINMQFDGRVVLKFGENDKFVAVANYGYAPLPHPRPPGKEQDEWRSREHYMGYRVTPKFGVYAGLMDQVYGIRVIEHIAYSRTIPQVAQNDQVHGVLLHYLGDSFEVGAHAHGGNLYQEEDLRMAGGSLKFEKTAFSIHRIGASVKKTSNDYLDLFSYSAHGRFNLKEGSSLLAEVGQTDRKTKNKTDDRTSRYALLQTYLRPFRGLYFLTNIEYLKRNLDLDDYSVRWGPGIQYFPFQRLELRLDLYNTRNFTPESSTPDSWMYLFQTHIWL